MEESIVMLIIVGILIVAIAISFAISKKKGNKGNKSTNTKSNSKDISKKSSDNGIARKDMSEFIRFDKIANDMIYQKKGEKYTMAIECKGINYDLMSEVEQMSVEEGFIKFLNTLKSPIQLYVQTRSINLADNVKKYKERTAMFDETYSDMISKYNDAEDDIDVSKGDTERLRMEKIKYGNIAEYANDITKYIERMSLNKFMLQRKYYVLISYYKSEIVATEKFTKEEYEELCYRELYTRAQGLIASLGACSIKGRILNSNELAELVYISYNRDDQRTMDVKRALESGFYRLYTTSPDVREKRKAMLDEEIKKAAAERVELAIQEGIKNGTLISEEEAANRIDKTIDKEAINMVNNSDISTSTKEKVKDLIVENRKKRLSTKKQIKEQKEEEKADELPFDDRMSSNVVQEDKKEQEEIKEQELREETEIKESKKVENETAQSSDKIITDDMDDTIITKNEEKKEDKIPSMNDEIDERENMGIKNINIRDELIVENTDDNKKTEASDDSLEDDSIV